MPHHYKGAGEQHGCPRRPLRRPMLGVAGLAGLGLLAALIAGGAPAGLFDAKPAAALENSGRTPASFADVAAKVRPAVASISTKDGSGWLGRGGRDFNFPDLPPDHPFREFFDQFRKGMPQDPRGGRPPVIRAQGSGFLISRDGYLVTNRHVVEKADEITVTFEGDEKYKAEVVGSDARTDVALLKLKTDKQFSNFLEFATEIPRVGDWVLAVGNPFGLGGTVTAGIVSAGGRDIGSSPYDFLQIDAAVNRGNSGGPAVNLNGKVIGVNTAIFSPTGVNVGIAFAIPADLVKEVIDQLRTTGKVSRGWLGVSIQNVTEEIAESLDLKEPKGAMVTKILDDGPAAKSEIKVGDVILEVNGNQISDSRDLARKIAALPPGADAKVTVSRSGKKMEVILKLGNFPSEDKFASLGSGKRSAEELDDLGLTLAPARGGPGQGPNEGVEITDIDPNSEASEKGLRRGDVIVKVGDKAVSEPSDVAAGVREAREKGKKAVLFQVRSSDQQKFVALSVAAEKKPGKDSKPEKDRSPDSERGRRGERPDREKRDRY